MEKLIICNYSTSSIHIYDVQEDADIKDESYLRKLGFNPDECSWMFTTELQIYFIIIY